MQYTPSRAKCQYNYCFLVFWYVCLYAYPKRCFGGEGDCACFRNNIPFSRPSSYFLWSNDFDNQQHFVLNCLWFIVCHWWAGIFVNNISPFWLDNRDVQGRNEVRRRLGHETSLAPPCSNQRSFESKWTVLKNWLWHCCDFWPPAVIRRPGNCVPCPPRYVSDGMQKKSENFPKINKF